jgi:hypothetical protein
VSNIYIDPRRIGKGKIYVECLDIECDYPHPEPCNLHKLLQDECCEELFAEVEEDILADLPSDCDFAIIFHEVVECCNAFFDFVKRTDYFKTDRVIDYVVCDHNMNEVPYYTFMCSFFEKIKTMLEKSGSLDTECHQMIIAIRHDMESLGLLQCFLECYAAQEEDEFRPLISKLLRDIVVDKVLDDFKVTDAPYGNILLHEKMQVCVFRNTYNLCETRGVRFSGTLLQCYLKQFFHHFVNLRDFMFTKQRSFLNIIKREIEGGDDEAFGTFVGVILNGLVCKRTENRHYYAEFLLRYTQSQT